MALSNSDYTHALTLAEDFKELGFEVSVSRCIVTLTMTKRISIVLADGAVWYFASMDAAHSYARGLRAGMDIERKNAERRGVK